MPTKINCPNCDASLKLPDAAAGRKVRCSKCSTPFVAPAAPSPEVTMRPPIAVAPLEPTPAPPVARQPAAPAPTPTPVVRSQPDEEAAPSGGGILGKMKGRASAAAKAISAKAKGTAPAATPGGVATSPTAVVAAPVAAPGEVRCPKCGSTQFTSNPKGFSHGKACLGWCLGLGILSIFCGGHGKNKILVTCLACGHQWKAGKA